MGCICSKSGRKTDNHGSNEKEKEAYKPSVAPVYPMKRDGSALSKREEVSYHGADGSAHKGSRRGGQTIISVVGPSEREDRKRAVHDNVTSSIHRRKSTTDMRMKGGASVSRIISLPNSVPAEPVVSGWPSWLSSVAGDAIRGWAPRPADTFEKLEKIGQGTYSSVYKARDLETGKTVAMKKVRFVNMDPESVRFMAREIYILRRLDHPNVMKLECIVTSRMSGSLYLVFEYMEHDLAGLFANRSIKFTESQIKCYIQQLFRGLEHCHKNGVLHRDIKGSNLLIGNNGILKIGDFGLATLFEPDKSQPLTSRVVTLWYRAPELLLGATEYGVGVDLWSTGCILAELFSGKPIMPGRTEVEQMHKIFKLCGSPSDKYWKTSKLPHATSFKPQHPYKRCVSETFRDFPHAALALVDKLLAISPEDRGSATLALASEFFMTAPLPCDPSSLPKYPPSKEFDAKMRDEIRRQRTGGGRGPESVRRGTVDIKEVPTPEFTHGQSNFRSSNVSGFDSQRPRGGAPRVLSQSSSTVHPVAVHSSWSKTRDTDERGPMPTYNSSRNMAQPKSQVSRHISAKAPKDAPILSQLNPAPSANYSSTMNNDIAGVQGHIPRKNRIHYSGPLMPPGGNMDDMLREHERQIQEAVRRARVEKVRPKNHDDSNGFLILPIRSHQ